MTRESLAAIGSRIMTEGSKWLEPTGIAAVFTIAFTVGGLVWGASAVVNSNTALAEKFTRVQVVLDQVQVRIGSLPTQGFRLDVVEHSIADVQQENARQNTAIGVIQQTQAVLVSTLADVRDGLRALQSAANGRLPGSVRR